MFLQSKLMRQRWVLALMAGIVATVLVACGNGSSSSSNTQPIYTMVFDAGSSGTRLSFFKVIPGNGGYPQITLIKKVKYDDDGINDFIMGNGVIDPTSWPTGYQPAGCNIISTPDQGGPNDVGPCVLQPLLDAMAPYLQQEGVTAAKVVTELYATAGMRTVALYNGGTKTDGQIADFYQTMKNYVSTSKGFAVGEYRTANGNSEEGLWTWINMNDQYFNAFGGNATYYTGTPTVRGDIEVGGSSMQVAFPTTTITPSDANNVYTVTINGRSYNVFSKTFLGLGGDDARKFMRSYGYTTGTDYNGGADCFGTSATAANTKESSGVALFYDALFFPNSGTITTNAINNTWSPSLGVNAFPLMLNSSAVFNANTCSAKYNAITTSVMALPRNNYGTIPGQTSATYSSFKTKVSQSSAPFIGVDGFYYAASFLNVDTPPGPIYQFTQTDFENSYSRTCNSGYTGDTTKGLRTQRSCADATYMRDFLWRSGGLFNQNPGAIFEGVAPNDFNGNEVLTWTRGYLLKKYAN